MRYRNTHSSGFDLGIHACILPWELVKNYYMNAETRVLGHLCMDISDYCLIFSEHCCLWHMVLGSIWDAMRNSVKFLCSMAYWFLVMIRVSES